jgi:pyruvate/2-oxoglutarate/acetoin dehydrogenase E1 component
MTLKYKEELIRSMEYLAENENVVFLGQSVAYSGNAIYNTLATIPADRKIETPVFEDVQMGMSIGLALEGQIPVTCYPRFDFVLLASNQLVNHLDKIQIMSNGDMKPRVIIRTSIGSTNPLHGGIQHTQDYTEAYKNMLRDNVEVVLLKEPEQIFSAYEKALTRKDHKCTLLVEYGDYYNEK